MAQNDSGYEFYVGPATHLEGASLAIDGTARIDGKIVGKVAVKHLIVGPTGCVVGDISGETAEIRAPSKTAFSFLASSPSVPREESAATSSTAQLNVWKVPSWSARFLQTGKLTKARLQ